MSTEKLRLVCIPVLIALLITVNLARPECNLNCTGCPTATVSVVCTGDDLIQVPMVSPFVLHLNLSRNRIEELNQQSFVHLPLVVTIDLGHNRIKAIPGRVFAGLGSLKKLYLNHNRINKIDEYGFRNLHELEELYLHANPLKHLDGNVFRELFKLKHLSIFPREHEGKDQADGFSYNDLITVCRCMMDRIEPLTFCGQDRPTGMNQTRCQAIFDMKIMAKNPKTNGDSFRKIASKTTAKPKNSLIKKLIESHHPKPIISNQSSVSSKDTYQTYPNINGSSPIFTEVPDLIYRLSMDSDVRLSCGAVGNPQPIIKWIRFGRTISFNSSLVLNKISPEDDGVYECTARNVNGRAAREVKIILIGSISPDSDLNQNRDLLNKIMGNDKDFRIEDLITTDVLKFVDLVRLLMAISDNQTHFQANDLTESNLLTPLQATIMNNFTGCVGGARFEAFNCGEEQHRRYYSITGICNNKAQPSRGSSVEPFLRLLPAEYDDGLVKPIGWFNQSREKFRKPNPRSVTEELLSTDKITNDPWNNHLLMQFGQFLDHDISFAALSDNRNMLENDIIDCERLCQNVEPCYSIPYPSGGGRDGCVEFKRSAEYCGTGFTSVVLGKLIKREQVNLLTAFIDGSQIYGNNDELSDFLRSSIQEDNGLLNATIQGNRTYLPYNNQHLNNDCQPEPRSFSNECFLAGDHRANEQLGLLVFHNLWLRNHNSLASKLKILRPEWSRDRIFHETRQIVAAQLQIITYRDWLPLILGSKGMKMLGPYRGYNQSVNPSIANSFAAAAMRFGHTLVNKYLIRKLFQNHPYSGNDGGSKSRTSDDEMRLHRTFFQPDLLLRPGFSDTVLLGLLLTPLKKTVPQQAITDELTEKLFKLSRYRPLDLSSINIQRGRDHGLPGYTKWRHFCNLGKASTFDDLRFEIKDDNIRGKLRKLYGHPDNVDLYVGGILEDSDEDAKLGPTFRCLLVNQFQRLRDGDRFFYKNKGQFSLEQLTELEKTSLSKLICDHGDGIESMVDNAFVLPKHQSWRECNLLADIDLTKW